MPNFRLITEGLSDQPVIENILYGFFGEENIDVAPIQPLSDATYRGKAESFGNWVAVLKHCESPEFAEIFQFPDNYVVIHIDTDVCEEPGYDVPKKPGGQAVPVRDLILRVAARLHQKIGPDVLEQFHERIVLAIAVDSIECWLLPLYAASGQKDKTLNCLTPLNRALAKQNLDTIGAGRKDRRVYDKLSSPYSKNATLMRHYGENPSLQVFVENLQALASVVSQPEAD